MAVIIEDTRMGYKFVKTPTPDGEDTEIVSDAAYNAIAESLQSESRAFADTLQSDCGVSADTPQNNCKVIVEPSRPVHRPRVLSENGNYTEIEKYLDDDKYIREISHGLYDNIGEVLEQQLSLPSYIIEDLQNKGMVIDDTKCRREIMPLYRLKLKDRQINKQKRVNIFLIVTLIIVSTLYALSFRTNAPTETSAEANAIITDSLTAAELHQYICEYTKLTNTKIYPYSEGIILQRINQKKITDIKGIHDEIENRVKELAKR